MQSSLKSPTDETFLCMMCDIEGRAAFVEYKGLHQYDLHDLVRCQPEGAEEEIPMELRLKNVEVQLSTQGKSLRDLETQLKNHEKEIHERLTRIEEMLIAVLKVSGKS